MTIRPDDFMRLEGLKAGELLSKFGDIDDDGWQCVIDSETDLKEAVIVSLRAAREQEAFAETCKKIADDLYDRSSRLLMSANAKRGGVAALLNEIGVKKLVYPDMTVSASMTKPKALVLDPEIVPDQFCRFKKSPDMTLINEIIEGGGTIPGVTVGNGRPTLSIRSK